MDEIKDGGLAFPGRRYESFRDAEGKDQYELITFSGMTLRDYFAAAAMQGMNASPALFEAVTTGSILDGTYYERAAKQAYAQADAMLRARQEK